MDQNITRQQRRFRARKGNRTVGYTQVPNARVTGMYQRLLAMMVAINKKRMVPLNGMQIQNEAYSALIARLPSAPRGNRNMPAIKPSKSDDPAYRRGGNFDKLTGQPIANPA